MGELGATSKEEHGKGQLLCAELGVLLPACPLTGKMEMGIGMKIIMIVVQYLCCVLYMYLSHEKAPSENQEGHLSMYFKYQYG